MAHKFVEKGKKVLLIDADPQCNLTCLVNGIADSSDRKHDISAELEKFYKTYDNIYCAIKDFLRGEVQQIEVENLKIQEVIQLKENGGALYLLPGHIDLAEAEPRITIAIERSQSRYDMPIYKKIPGVFRKLYNLLAEKYSIDYIFVDMSPSIGILNRCLLMNSDYFVIPCSPDFFSLQALDSISRIMPEAYEEFNAFRIDKNLNGYSLPSQPQFLGYITQKYRVTGGKKGKTAQDQGTVHFEKWISQIQEKIKNSLIPSLVKSNMVREGRYFYRKIPEFNSLIAWSQTNGRPVFEATPPPRFNPEDKMREISKRQFFGAIFDDIFVNIEEFTKTNASQL